uniref:Myeloid differentiation primary response protein MyD88 n=1 Tax=Eptatretus burgeri TaxID=7764 RepID=A0A8C4QHX2_EPTBU
MAHKGQAKDCDSDSNRDSIDYDLIPLAALRIASRRCLGLWLGSGDWWEIGTRAKLSDGELETIARQGEPVTTLLSTWSLERGGSVGRLLALLEQLDRIDILVTVSHLLYADCQAYLQSNVCISTRQPVQLDSGDLALSSNMEMSSEALTLNDNPSGPKAEHFDAFICYCNNDLHFVKEMIEQLEASSFCLKLCVFDRDVLPGLCVWTISSELIEKRCRKMVVVISDDFLDSEQCDFQIKFALSLAPGMQKKRLIPVVYRPISKPYPNFLRHITMSDYTKASTKYWFWQRLAKAINIP